MIYSVLHHVPIKVGINETILIACRSQYIQETSNEIEIILSFILHHSSSFSLFFESGPVCMYVCMYEENSCENFRRFNSQLLMKLIDDGINNTIRLILIKLIVIQKMKKWKWRRTKCIWTNFRNVRWNELLRDYNW